MRCLVTGGSGFIGINMIDYLQTKDVHLLNIDIKAPPAHQKTYWKQCDILDANHLQRIFGEFHPTHVIHLAARTDTTSNKLADYRANTEGTRNVLQAIKKTPSITRAIITSSQFVHGPGSLPCNDNDFRPVGAYGQSKVITEQLTRAADLNCVWTIIRPTNIWGPWHPRYPYQFWRVLSKRLYIHPNGRSPVRCFGYIENIIFQIDKILQSSAEIVNQRTFYVGDRPIRLIDWVNGFSVALTGKRARYAPRSIVRGLASIGDICTLFGMPFPITSSRYRSMTEDYLVPMEKTFTLFGDPPFSLEEGVRKTAKWLKEMGFVKTIFV